MKLELLRLHGGTDDTIGVLYALDGGARRLLCFTLEDEYRSEKVRGETRIPAGTYQIKLRTESPLNTKYKRRFSRFHKGMLWLQHVPGFRFIYIHCGNTDQDTDGCILLGNKLRENVTGNGYLSQSADAYRRVYPKLVASAARANLSITVTDLA